MSAGGELRDLASFDAAALVIDAATGDDVPRIAALEAEAYDAPYSLGEGPEGRGPDVSTSAARLHEELTRPWTQLWVARRRLGGEASLPRAPPDLSEPLGFLLAWYVVDELHVLNLATGGAYRRRGVGGALVSHAVRWTAARGGRHLLLEVRRSNLSAQTVYRRAGFFVTNVRRGYYADHEDAIEMRLTLDPKTGAPVPQDDEVGLGSSPPPGGPR